MFCSLFVLWNCHLLPHPIVSLLWCCPFSSWEFLSSSFNLCSDSFWSAFKGPLRSAAHNHGWLWPIPFSSAAAPSPWCSKQGSSSTTSRFSSLVWAHGCSSQALSEHAQTSDVPTSDEPSMDDAASTFYGWGVLTKQLGIEMLVKSESASLKEHVNQLRSAPYYLALESLQSRLEFKCWSNLSQINGVNGLLQNQLWTSSCNSPIATKSKIQ